MMRTALLALIVGVFASGCVITTGGTPSRSTPSHHYKGKSKSKNKSNQTAAPAPAPAPAPTGGGEAVAAPPVATPAPGGTQPATSPPRRDLMLPGLLGPQGVHVPNANQEEEEEKKEDATKTPVRGRPPVTR